MMSMDNTVTVVKGSVIPVVKEQTPPWVVFSPIVKIQIFEVIPSLQDRMIDRSLIENQPATDIRVDSLKILEVLISQRVSSLLHHIRAVPQGRRR
jgi:hypothetical protein